MIGIFDSGVGGLTVLSAMRKSYPSIDVVYFGDTKNAPYGPRSRSELSVLTVEGIKFLIDRGATTIVSACNSVSASIAVSLFDAFSLSQGHLIEMVGPTVAAFKGSDLRVALCATEATIESEIYQNAFHMIGKDIQAIAIPELAGMIETGASEEAMEFEISNAFATIPEGSYDIVVLGCTHYPLVLDAFRHVLKNGIDLFDPADAVAARIERDFWPREVGSGAMQFYLSKDSDVFRGLVERLFQGAEYTVEVVE